MSWSSEDVLWLYITEQHDKKSVAIKSWSPSLDDYDGYRGFLVDDPIGREARDDLDYSW